MTDVVVVLNPEELHHLAAVDGPIAKHLHEMAAPVLTTMAEGVGKATGQLAASLGIVMVEADGKAEIRIGVMPDSDTRADGKVTNSALLLWDEFGNGHEPAKHTATQALGMATQ